MSGFIVALSSHTASAGAVLVTLLASVVLLSLRAWSGASGFKLTRRVSLMLDGAVVILLVLFLVLVVVRFKTVG